MIITGHSASHCLQYCRNFSLFVCVPPSFTLSCIATAPNFFWCVRALRHCMMILWWRKVKCVRVFCITSTIEIPNDKLIFVPLQSKPKLCYTLKIANKVIVFHPTIRAAILQYFPCTQDTTDFFNLFHMWWVISNFKRFKSNHWCENAAVFGFQIDRCSFEWSPNGCKSVKIWNYPIVRSSHCQLRQARL